MMSLNGPRLVRATELTRVADVNVPRVVEVEFRCMQGDVNQYIDIDIHSQTVTKSDFQREIINKTGWHFNPEHLKFSCSCGEWTEPLLKDNPAFVDYVEKTKYFWVSNRE
jgi:hypothetical protein